MDKVLLAAIQMTSKSSLDENLIEARKQVDEAAMQGAKIIVLPENFSLMGNHERDKLKVSEPDQNGRIQDFLSQTARANQVWLIGGTIPVQSRPGKVFAACLAYDESGRRVGRYDKIHLFDVALPGSEERYEESATIDPGENPLVLDTPYGRVGLSVCYDLRFPELYRNMAFHGMDIVVVPSAFTASTGAAHWEVLLRARAIENQCYVIASNQGGRHENGRQTYGHSMIIDPWGTILALLPDGPGVVLAEMDPRRLSEVRTNFPSLRHARPIPPLTPPNCQTPTQ